MSADALPYHCRRPVFAPVFVADASSSSDDQFATLDEDDHGKYIELCFATHVAQCILSEAKYDAMMKHAHEVPQVATNLSRDSPEGSFSRKRLTLHQVILLFNLVRIYDMKSTIAGGN